MDSEDFNQYALTADELRCRQISEGKHGTALAVLQGQGHRRIRAVIVELEVVETEPGIKGDTASGGSKTAVMDTGLAVQVPLFINVVILN